MPSCKSESEAYEQCKKDSSSCDKLYEKLQQCKTGLFFEMRSKNKGLAYRPTPNLEFNSNGPNIIFHEDDVIVFGSQGLEFKFGSFKI